MTNPSQKALAAQVTAEHFASSLPVVGAVIVEAASGDEMPTEVFTFRAPGSTPVTLVVGVLDNTALASGTGGAPLSEALAPAAQVAATSAGAGTATVDPTGTVLGPDAYRVLLGGEPILVVSVALGQQDAALGGAPSADGVRRIRNVSMDLSVVIGRTTLTVSELLSMSPGHVIELDRSAGAPADVMLNGRHIARGEVVVVDQDFAVRITGIVEEGEGALL